MAEFVLQTSVAAPPEIVFDVLTDHRAYPGYTPLRKVKLEREGSPDANGVGAIRALHAVGPPIREEVLEFEEPRRLVYRMLSGAPVNNHVGTVTLAPEGDGTRVTWRIETTPTVPIGGFAVVGIVRLAVSQLLGGIAKEAEARAAHSAASA